MAVDTFLKLDGVKGEAQDDKHKAEIDVLAWSWGMSQAGTAHMLGGAGAGKVTVHDISITKPFDKSSPVLMQHCSSGKHIDSGVLTVRKAGGKEPLEYLIITMKEVFVTSISTGGSGDGTEHLSENVSLNFGEVKVEYQPQKKDGTADGGKIPWSYNIAANKQQ